MNLLQNQNDFEDAKAAFLQRAASVPPDILPPAFTPCKLATAFDEYVKGELSFKRWTPATATDAMNIYNRISKWLLAARGVTMCHELTQKTVLAYFAEEVGTELELCSLRHYTLRLITALNFMVSQGYIEAAQADDIIKKIYIKPQRISDPPPTRIADEDVRKIFAYIKTKIRSGKVNAYRDLVIFRLMLDQCLRSGAICHMQIGHVNLTDMRLTVRNKGGKWEEVPLAKKLGYAMEHWLEIRKHMGCPAGPEDPLFPFWGGFPTTSGVYHVVHELFKRCGVKCRKLGPHVLRHTGATKHALKNAAPAVLQEILLHKSIRTTQKYINIVRSDVKDFLDANCDFDRWVGKE